MIYFKNISLAFGETTVFRQMSWTVHEKSRIGLVGDNGTGKTTLLKAILGQVELDEGSVEIADKKNRIIGYLPQDLVELEPVPVIDYLKKKSGLATLEEAIRDYEQRLSLHPPPDPAITERNPEAMRDEEPAIDQGVLKAYEAAMAAFQAKNGYAFESKARQILKGIGFRDGDATRNCAEFSGGWKMRLLLAVILLSQPDIMLLDEPINHLDTESLEWLENYLKDYPGTLITVAHDRVFLDKIVNQIAELSRQTLTLYRGNYSAYLKEKEKRRAALKKEMALQKEEIKRTQDFIERFRFKATKSRQVQSRLKMLERIEIVRDEETARSIAIRFPPCPKSGKEVIRALSLTKYYGDLRVLDRIDFTVYRGDRIALVGINGSGKSTLSRILSGHDAPTAGEIIPGLNVSLSYFSQESAENLDYERTIWDEVSDLHAGGNDQDRRNILGAFLLSGDSIHKPVRVLSGGEKSRLALVKILLQNANVLILDEPTNHLDLKTKDIFQNALLAYHGTVIIVSHDRYFLDRLVNRVWELKGGRIHEYAGNYSYFIDKRKEMQSDAAVAVHDADGTKERKTLSRAKEERRLEAEERNRLSRIRNALRRELSALEQSISHLEKKKSENDALLCHPETFRNPEKVKALSRESRIIAEELDLLYVRWQEANLNLDQGTDVLPS